LENNFFHKGNALLFEAVNTSDVMAWNSASFCEENRSLSWNIFSFLFLLSLHTRNG